MKKFITCSFIYLASLNLLSQNDSTFCEIGLNATAFVNQYLDFDNNDNDILSPYILIAEKKFGCIGLRGGLGLDTFTDKEFPDDDNGNTSLRVTETDLSARLGLVWYTDVSPRWSFRYGVDATFGYMSSKSKTVSVNLFGDEVTTLIKSDSNDAGGGPFFFAQFNLNKRVSLATEVTGYFTLVTEVSKEENSEFPQFNDEDKNQSYGFSILPPTALFITWRF
ncbi:MAG: hypothetical protein SH856_00560 [Flavobacteriales bacterium]|nr:hypothetical protein [Flavobacteriales bacterium]